VNVIPSQAEAMVDGRFLPGHEEGFLAELDARLGAAVTREVVHLGRAVEAPWEHPLVEAMCRVLAEHDPAARPLPFMISGGTDAKHLSRLGIQCYGFSPLLLTPDLDFSAMFHGVDERVPVDALGFGSAVLLQLLTTY
jgi:acetylornithine deacetylase/succinyl-diaminopimelate desuccinylase-like protein